MNPLFNALGGGQMPGAIGDFQRMMQQFQQIFGLQLAASQAAQNQYLVNTIRPCPVPAYTVANPFCCNQAQYCAG